MEMLLVAVKAILVTTKTQQEAELHSQPPLTHICMEEGHHDGRYDLEVTPNLLGGQFPNCSGEPLGGCSANRKSQLALEKWFSYDDDPVSDAQSSDNTSESGGLSPLPVRGSFFDQHVHTALSQKFGKAVYDALNFGSIAQFVNSRIEEGLENASFFCDKPCTDY